jgi:DNA-binding MarR family transcriptional regulator
MDYSNEQVKLAAEVLQSYWNINKATVALSRQNAVSLGITLYQMAILNTLLSSPNITLKELTEKLMASKSTISVNTDELVQSGLVERSILEANRREVKLTLTDKGRELSKKSIENANSYRAMASVLGKMSGNDIQTLLRINNEIIKYLESND